MAKITLYLDKQQEEFVKALSNISGCKRYTIAKLTFQVGMVSVEMLAEVKKNLLDKLQTVGVNTNKEK